MYQNHPALLKKDLTKLLVAPQTGGMQGSPPVEQEDQFTLPELLPLLMWRSRLKRRQQPHPVTLKKRLKKRNGRKAAGMCVN